MVTYEELYKIAALAKLSLENEDMDALAVDMSGIIGFADAVSVAGAGSLGTRRELAATALRTDEVAPSLDTELVLKNAPESANGFFLARSKPQNKEEPQK